MPLGFIIVAVALIVVAWRNTQADLFALLKQDVPGFAKWAIAIIVIGVLQYIPSFQTAAKYLLILVLLVIVIANKGAFANFQAAFSGTPASIQTGPSPALTGSPTVDLTGGGSSAGNAASTAASGLGAAAKVIPFIGGGLFGG